ncbi:MAG: carbon-nitrogen hydrolase family protein, partial [Armatimonadetes bacterium]|nr:carbon-nitrogen hydrolase family protein [Armatimonadota bacterium]
MSKQSAKLATTQWSYRETPAEANPYSDIFSLDAARDWSRESIDGALELVAKTGAEGADLAVMGEDIASTSYALTYLDDPSVFQTLSREMSEYARDAIAAVAKRHGMHVVACFFEPDGDVIRNTSALFGRDGGEIGRYHKVHLPVYETWLVAAGDGFPVYETDIGVVGMLICYDDMWSESSASCALNGARIICHSSAYSPPEYRVRTRATDAQVFYLTSTRTGSRICAPDSTILADCGDGDGIAVVEADIQGGSLAPENYWEYLYSGIRDHRERHLKLRRPDAYSVLRDVTPPALAAYSVGGLRTSKEAVSEVYEKQKE